MRPPMKVFVLGYQLYNALGLCKYRQVMYMWSLATANYITISAPIDHFLLQPFIWVEFLVG